MANFVPSDLVAGQAIFTEKFQSGEWRMPDSAALTTAVSGGIANPALAGLRTREDRAVNAYFPIRQAAINDTARAHDHTGARGDSLAESITWTTYAEPFSISIKQADNNVFNFAEMFASTQKNALFNLLNRVDAAFVANLIANKSQIGVDGGNGDFDQGVSNDYIVASADQDYFFENTKAFMEQNLYRGQLTAIVDSRANVLARRVSNQGGANSENLQYQMVGYDTVAASTRTILDVPTTYTESGIFFETGLVGAIPWVPLQNRKGLDPEKAMSYVGDYGQISMPNMAGMNVAIHSYGQRADGSASGGYTQDVVLEFELSIDMGFVQAPLSTFRGANDSVVFTAGVAV